MISSNGNGAMMNNNSIYGNNGTGVVIAAASATLATNTIGGSCPATNPAQSPKYNLIGSHKSTRQPHAGTVCAFANLGYGVWVVAAPPTRSDSGSTPESSSVVIANDNSLDANFRSALRMDRGVSPPTAPKEAGNGWGLDACSGPSAFRCTCSGTVVDCRDMTAVQWPAAEDICAPQSYMNSGLNLGPDFPRNIPPGTTVLQLDGTGITAIDWEELATIKGSLTSLGVSGNPQLDPLPPPPSTLPVTSLHTASARATTKGSHATTSDDANGGREGRSSSSDVRGFVAGQFPALASLSLRGTDLSRLTAASFAGLKDSLVMLDVSTPSVLPAPGLLIDLSGFSKLDVVLWYEEACPSGFVSLSSNALDGLCICKRAPASSSTPTPAPWAQPSPIALVSKETSPTSTPSPGALVFDNPNYPNCCYANNTLPNTVCMFRIPVVLHIPGTRIVMAFAEARLGAWFNPDPDHGEGCRDGSGPGIAMKRSTDGGRTWPDSVRWVGNDTQPSHVALKDHNVLGMVMYEPTTRTSFLFYTACYVKCMYTTTYVLKSKDDGVTWSKPAEGNLTGMLLEGDDGISMMQFGEGQGVMLPSTEAGRGGGNRGSEMMVCGWYKPKGTPAGEFNNKTSIACLHSTDQGETWSIKGRTPPASPPHVGAVNEVALGLMRNGSIFLSVREDEHVLYRRQSRSNDGGKTFSAPQPGQLPAPRCNAGVLNLHNNSELVLAHVEPGLNSTARTHMTVRASSDGGTTWPYRQVIWAAPAAYVALTTSAVGDGSSVGMLYENGNDGEPCYRRISYRDVEVAT